MAGKVSVVFHVEGLKRFVMTLTQSITYKTKAAIEREWETERVRRGGREGGRDRERERREGAI